MDIEQKENAKPVVESMAPQRLPPKRLRDSCDVCALSKVRCDRGQPSCQRCLKQDVVCNYSPARRLGKGRPSGVTTSGGQRSLENKRHKRHKSRPITDVGSIIKSSHEQHIEQSSSDAISSNNFDRAGPMASTASDDSGVDLAQTEFERELLTPWADMRGPAETSTAYTGREGDLLNDNFTFSDADFSMPEHWESQISTSPLLNIISPCTNDLQSYLSMFDDNISVSAVADITRQCPTPSLTGSTTPDLSKDCTNLALSSLESLHMPIVSCTLTSSSGSLKPPTIDSVLKNNKAAINHVSSILSCACSLNSNLALLVALVCSKVMESYTTISRTRNRSWSSESSDISSLESVADLPITIGGYLLDGDVKGKLISQVLLSELSQVRKVVDKLASRHSPGAENEAKGELGSALISFLRLKLRSAVRVVMEDLDRN